MSVKTGKMSKKGIAAKTCEINKQVAENFKQALNNTHWVILYKIFLEFCAFSQFTLHSLSGIIKTS